MTNKSLFIIIFLIFIIGLFTGLNVIYQQVINPSEKNELSVSLLKEKLKASEKEIRIITNENGAMRAEISKLKSKLDSLYQRLDDQELSDQRQDKSLEET